jgi:hypothetical protein
MFRELRRTAVSSLVLGIVLALALGGTAAAYYVVANGSYGGFDVTDTADDPGARCGYGDPDSHGVAVVKWVKIMNTTYVWATDPTPGRDHQKVTWRFQIQRQRGSGPWKTVASSDVLSKTAYDDTPASFAPMKLYWTSNKQYDEHVRGRVLLKWWRNGSVEGTVKLFIEYYSVKWTVGDPSYIYGDYCLGHAD